MSELIQGPAGTFGTADAEAKLAAKLMEAEEELAHMDFADSEQRAEIYTILQVLKADSLAHQKLVGQWVNDQTGETHHV